MEIKPQPGPQEMFLATPADIAIYGGAAGGGKALDVDTPIFTDSGWKWMGDITEQDRVFSPDGSMVQVVKAFEPYFSDQVFVVRFDTGDELIADADHQWLTFDDSERNQLRIRSLKFRARRRENRPLRGSGKRPDLSLRNSVAAALKPEQLPTGTVRTTKELQESLYSIRGALNHSIEVCQPVVGSPWSEEVDPYLLGVWLGDGTCREGMITVAEQEMLDRLLKINPQIYRQPSQPLGYLVPGLTTWIRKKGLQNNKHIPEWVLQADAKSRLAVLQGLMDSDGTALKNGKLEFSVVNRALADGFKMLACSLGIKVNCSTSVAKLNGRDCGIRYRLQFRTILPVFRLQRKLERMRSTLRGLSLRRFIVAIEPTTSRMVRCITVASENSLYLAGKGFIATHNSWAILLESLRHVIHNTGFYACYFRRNATQVRNPGGLWDESMKLYALAGGEPSVHSLEWVWPRGGRIKFSHLEYDDTVLNWQGSQIALICFDELTHFSASQFWYMLSRNRSMCGVRPYVRATTNPDADSWVAEFISWWIDQNTGLPIVERGGKIRWFIRVNDALVWADSPEELKASYGDQVMPKSVTFIPATIHDNKKLLESDPGYMANLMALDTVERERLLDGNWKIRPAAGMFFKKECVRWYDHKQPPQHLNIYAASDYAVTDGGGDYTELGIFGIDPAQNIFVLDWWYGQTDSSVWIERQIDMIQKWKPIEWIGEAGVIMRALESSINKRMLERKVFCKLRWLPSISNKPTRARAFQARWALGKVYMPMDDQEYPTGLPWAQRLLQQMDNFPTEGAHDDGVDVCSLIGRTIDDLFGAVPPDADAATSKPDDDYGVDEDDYGDWMTA